MESAYKKWTFRYCFIKTNKLF